MVVTGCQRTDFDLLELVNSHSDGETPTLRQEDIQTAYLTLTNTHSLRKTLPTHIFNEIQTDRHPEESTPTLSDTHTHPKTHTERDRDTHTKRHT